MRTIKISDKSYNFLKRRSEEDRRPMTTVLDLIVEKEENAKRNICKNRKMEKI